MTIRWKVINVCLVLLKRVENHSGILTVTLVGRSRRKPPFHQVTVAGGLDPALWQASSYSLPALRAVFCPINFTVRGPTRTILHLVSPYRFRLTVPYWYCPSTGGPRMNYLPPQPTGGIISKYPETLESRLGIKGQRWGSCAQFVAFRRADQVLTLKLDRASAPFYLPFHHDLCKVSVFRGTPRRDIPCIEGHILSENPNLSWQY